MEQSECNPNISLNILQTPEDYDIMAYWNDEINGNESEMESMPKGFKRDNKNIIGYTIVNSSQKYSCIGDGIIHDGKEPKELIKINGSLGYGAYFYEYNFRYALDKAKLSKIDIVGAVLSPKKVLDFTDGTAISILEKNEGQFKQYIQNLKNTYTNKLSTLKNKSSDSYKKYESELSRISTSLSIADYINFLDRLGKQDSNYKYDAIRYIVSEPNCYRLGIPIYQSTVLCIKNKSAIIEYFNPLNKQEREAIVRDYFNNQSPRTTHKK